MVPQSFLIINNDPYGTNYNSRDLENYGESYFDPYAVVNNNQIIEEQAQYPQ